MATAARLDDPGALGGVLTGVSFIGGMGPASPAAPAGTPRRCTGSCSRRRAGPRRGAGPAAGRAGLAGRRTGVLPRPLMTAALASAGVDALAPVVLAVPKAALVVPAPPSSFSASAVPIWPAAQELAEMQRGLVADISQVAPGP